MLLTVRKLNFLFDVQRLYRVVVLVVEFSEKLPVDGVRRCLMTTLP